MKNVLVATRSATPGAAVRRAFQHVVDVVVAWKSRRDIAALVHLDDHMLKDIGVTRADIQAAFSAPLRTDPSRTLAARARDNQAGARAAARERLRVSRLWGTSAKE